MAASQPAFAAALEGINYGGVIANGSTITYYYPTKGQAAVDSSCFGQQATVSTDSGRAAPVPIDVSNTAPVALTSSVLSFKITNSATLATISGQNPAPANAVSIRVETSGAVALPLVVLESGHDYNGTVNEISYGATDGTPVTFGVALRDVLLTDTPASPPPAAANGLCKLLATALTNVAALNFCNPPGGTNPTPFNLIFGLVRQGQPLSDALSDTTVDSGQTTTIVLTGCPVGHAVALGNFVTPTFNFGVVPGDQRVKLANNTKPPVDTIVPVTGVVVSADTQYPVALGAPIQRVNTAVGGGVYTIDGLVNDTRYCFSFGYVNAAGWASTDASWSANLVTPNPQQCATPSQIDGFLDRSTCFIASAAYGEEWDPRLEALRQFRDQVLDHFSAGRAFTEWYYSWSPSAAHWLFANPSYRTFVQLALLPVVEFARFSLWIRNNMWVFGVLFFMGTIMAATVRRRTT